MKHYILALIAFIAYLPAWGNNPLQPGNRIVGHIIEKGTENSIPYATIQILGLGNGTVSNENGEFELKGLAPKTYKLKVKAMGYLEQEKEVTVSADYTIDMHFEMIEESFSMDEVVVSANRNEVSRRVAPVVVNVMNTKLFETVNSTDLSKSLSYQSGLRVENNCQNCGFP